MRVYNTKKIGECWSSFQREITQVHFVECFQGVHITIAVKHREPSEKTNKISLFVFQYMKIHNLSVVSVLILIFHICVVQFQSIFHSSADKNREQSDGISIIIRRRFIGE